MLPLNFFFKSNWYQTESKCKGFFVHFRILVIDIHTGEGKRCNMLTKCYKHLGNRLYTLSNFWYVSSKNNLINITLTDSFETHIQFKRFPRKKFFDLFFKEANNNEVFSIEQKSLNVLQ